MPLDCAARLEAWNAKKAEEEAQWLARQAPTIMVNMPPPSPQYQAAAAVAAAAAAGSEAGYAAEWDKLREQDKLQEATRAGNIFQQQQGGRLTIVQITPPLQGLVVLFGTHQVPWTGGLP